MKNKILPFNQMSGPLFNDVALKLSTQYNVVLHTGHPDTIINENIIDKIKLIKTIKYNTKNLLSRLISSLIYLIQITPFILKCKKNDLIIIVSNPPILGLYFSILNFFKNTNFIVDVYDIYPDVLISKNIFSKNHPLIKIWQKVNKMIYSKSIVIFTLSESMKKLLIKKNISLSNKITVTYPWVDTKLLKPIKKVDNPFLEKFSTINSFNILYSGNFGSSHDFSTLLNAALLLKSHENISFIFIGRGSRKQEIVEFIISNNLSNIKIFDFQPENIFPYSIAISDISIVTIENQFENLMIPSKLFSYLAIGSPIISISSSRCEIANIIDNAKCGYVVDYGDSKKLSKIILELYSNNIKFESLKKNSLSYVNKYHSKEHALNVILKKINYIFDEIN